MFKKSFFPKFLTSVLTLMVLLQGHTLLSISAAQAQTFSDVSSTDWYFQAVENGVTKKYIASAPNYRPADYTRRSETAKLLTLFAGYSLNLSQTELDEISFKDSPENEWYTDYVKILVSKQVINGYLDNKGNPTGLFGPADFVTRNQTAALLNRILKLEFDTPLDSPFSDIAYSHWAYADVMALYSAGIIKGYDDKTYRGDTLINRAEMAAILDRAQAWLKKDVPITVPDPLNPDEPTPPTDTPVQPDASSVDPASLNNQNVTFEGQNGQTLTGRLYKPEGKGPFPAMVFMHGCSGLLTGGASTNYLASQYVWWGEKMANEEKVVALFVDSFTPRNIKDGVCGDDGTILNEATERPKDAYAGLAYLRGLDYVTDKKIGLMGWSNGGSSVLSAMAKTNNPVTLPADGFLTGVTQYPGCGLRNQFGTDYLSTGKGTYLPYAPVIILSGDADTTTPPTPKCVNLVNRAHELGASAETGNDINLTIYPGATHSFDGAKAGSSAADWTAQEAGRMLILSHLDAIFKN